MQSTLMTQLTLIEQNLQNADQPAQYQEVLTLVTQLATTLAFSPEPALDLSAYGLVPMLNLSPQQWVQKPVETTLPLLRNKRIHWRMNWRADYSVDTLFIKLGTGGRVNHCQLIWSIFDEHSKVVATAQIDGTTVVDGQWTALVLTAPLLKGQYFGELISPDADNQVNTLFLWVTIGEGTDDLGSITDNVIDLYRYGITPMMALSTPSPKQLSRSVELAWPLWRGKILQWYFEIASLQPPVSVIYLKLATAGKVKSNQLQLSLFNLVLEDLTWITTLTIDSSQVRDNHWTEVLLPSPLSVGSYIARLTAPQAETIENTLLVGLTWLGLDNYCYVSPAPTTRQRQRVLSTIKSRPRISLIVPVMIEEEIGIPPYLSSCLNSIWPQIYPDWELCLVTNQVAIIQNWLDTNFTEFSNRYAKQIQIIDSPPAMGLQHALTVITGEYLAMLFPTDQLTEDALLEIVMSLNQNQRAADLLYSDEDQVNAGESYNEPAFKPEWSPELLKGYFYIGQLGVYRTTLVRSLGGFRAEFYQSIPTIPTSSQRWQLFQGLLTSAVSSKCYEGQIWDLVLRLTELTQCIQHIPKVLYHRRRQWPLVGSGTMGQRVVTAALNREGLGGQLIPNPMTTTANLWRYPVRGQPLVSIVIPTKDSASLLATCLDSLCRLTTYPQWEVVVVDNGSQEATTFNLFKHYQTRLGQAFRVIRQEIPFNFSKLVNAGVRAANGEVIVLLNNDTELLGPPDWLSQMLGFAQQPSIGVVGGKLLYPQENTIQHAGLICGVAGVANHSHKHFPAYSLGYGQRLAVIANYSAITGACLMVTRARWEQIHGFDEQLGIAFNDVDFCLKLLAAGCRHLVLPHITFYHHESKSRGLENTLIKQRRLIKEEAYMRRRWGVLLKQDPYYNLHLTQRAEDFSLNLASIYGGARQSESWWRKIWQWLVNDE